MRRGTLLVERFFSECLSVLMVVAAVTWRNEIYLCFPACWIFVKFDFARSEALKGMKVTNIKPQKFSSSSLWAKVCSMTGLFIQALSIRTYIESLTNKRAPLRDGGTSGRTVTFCLDAYLQVCTRSAGVPCT